MTTNSAGLNRRSLIFSGSLATVGLLMGTSAAAALDPTPVWSETP